MLLHCPLELGDHLGIGGLLGEAHADGDERAQGEAGDDLVGIEAGIPRIASAPA